MAVLTSTLPIYAFFLSRRERKKSSDRRGPWRGLWHRGFIGLKNGPLTKDTFQVSRRPVKSQNDDDIELFEEPGRPIHAGKDQHGDDIDEEASNIAIVSPLGSNGKDPLSSQTNASSPDRRDDLESARADTSHIGLTREVEVVAEKSP